MFGEGKRRPKQETLETNKEKEFDILKRKLVEIIEKNIKGLNTEDIEKYIDPTKHNELTSLVEKYPAALALSPTHFFSDPEIPLLLDRNDPATTSDGTDPMTDLAYHVRDLLEENGPSDFARYDGDDDDLKWGARARLMASRAELYVYKRLLGQPQNIAADFKRAFNESIVYKAESVGVKGNAYFKVNAAGDHIEKLLIRLQRSGDESIAKQATEMRLERFRGSENTAAEKCRTELEKFMTEYADEAAFDQFIQSVIS